MESQSVKRRVASLDFGAEPSRSRLILTLWLISVPVFLRNRAAVAGTCIVLLIVILAVGAPLFAPYDPVAQSFADRLSPPEASHWFGTDKFGRDILSGVIWGSRVSLQIGVIAVLLAANLGTLLGLFAGYAGGWVDEIVMRVMDVFLTLPTLVLALVMVAVLGSSLTNVMIAVGVTMLPDFARLVRGSVLAEREKDYIVAARAIGVHDHSIVIRHVFPNIFSPIIVLGTLRIATAILIEANLSFLGLGVEFDRPTWGKMINGGRAVLQLAPWVSIIPGAAIMLTVLGFSLMGDGLREAMDPRLR